jgi:hypothetical protein
VLLSAIITEKSSVSRFNSSLGVSGGCTLVHMPERVGDGEFACVSRYCGSTMFWRFLRIFKILSKLCLWLNNEVFDVFQGAKTKRNRAQLSATGMQLSATEHYSIAT